MADESDNPRWLRFWYAGETLLWVFMLAGGIISVLGSESSNAFHTFMHIAGILLPLALMVLGIVRVVRARGILTGKMAPAIQVTSSVTRALLWVPACLFLDVGNMASWTA